MRAEGKGLGSGFCIYRVVGDIEWKIRIVSSIVILWSSSRPIVGSYIISLPPLW